jgi:glycosyltransferase involved in cell wall biosynthesis
MMMPPKVSFVVPVWDGDAYLAETLESIRSQSLQDIEIIVIDDCSPDFTPELMEWFTKLDNRIKYHRLDVNGGVCEARNYGNRLAESEVICVSDQDDLSTHHRALYSYHYLLHHPEIDCLTSDYHECNVDGFPVKKVAPLNMTKELHEKTKEPWFHSSACYRKKDILELPYRVIDNTDGTYIKVATDDYVFLTDWLNAGKKFHTTRKVLANCRRLPWSQMQTYRQLQGLQESYIL